MRCLGCFIRAGLALLGCYVGFSTAACAQLLEVCTVKPAAAPQWSLSCERVNAKQKDRAGPPLSEPFNLPTLPEVTWCNGTVLKPVVQSVPLDFPALITRINGSGYTLTPSGNYVLTVSKAPTAAPAKKAAKKPSKKPTPGLSLTALNQTIKLLLRTVPANPGSFSVELVMPHAAAFGSSLASQVSALNRPFTIKPTGKDRLTISTANGVPPSCDDWNAFLLDLRELAWSIHSEPFEARLTASDASAMATALGGGGQSAPASTPTSPASAGGATPGVSIGSIEPDLLAFSDTTPGNDSLITEKKREAAILDLPRPEMTISAWVMQNSSTDPESVNQSSQKVREEVRLYNQGLEETVLQGWAYLQQAMADPKYFDQTFYNYIARRVLFDGMRSHPHELQPGSIQQQAHDLLNEQTARSENIANPQDSMPSPQDYLGACGQNEYCLGYTTLFHPLKPRLTDMMLALIAAANPMQQVNCAVDRAEGGATHWENDQCADGLHAIVLPSQQCTKASHLIPCEIWRELEQSDRKGLEMPKVDPRTAFSGTCEEKDYLGLLQSMMITRTDGPMPVMFLNCFRGAARSAFHPKGDLQIKPLGLMRAAIADFLFNYKMSQQYPHEFTAYDLTTSAQAMNSALRPLVDAYVRDVTAYQVVLKRRLGLQIEYINKHISGGSAFDKARFFNNALVSVNTIANSEAVTDTTVESYLEASRAPTLGGLAGAVSGALNSAANSTTQPASATSQALGAAPFAEAQLIAAGVSQFQSGRIHIGRELSVDVKPEALLGADSAELQVTLKADDEATSGLYSSGANTGADAEVSRFGKNDTTTRVRVDSLKLFEVSSFASQLMAPKKRFPILPVPGLEMPYFGAILSVPLPPAREFHTSMAVISAVVIPTAADLAFSARFVSDRLLAPENASWNAAADMDKACVWPTDRQGDATKSRPPCRTRQMVSLRDFNGQPVREFNRMMTHCLATGGASAEPNLLPADRTSLCSRLTYDDVVGEAQ